MNGCARFFNAARHRRTDKFLTTYKRVNRARITSLTREP